MCMCRRWSGLPSPRCFLPALVRAWPIAFFAYFLAFFIPGGLIQVMAIRGWKRKHLLLLIVPCLIGAVLVLV